VNAASSDPLKSVADALDAAVQAAKGGADDAYHAAAEALPRVEGMVSNITYKTFYAISYGIVFPTMLAARAIPKENAVVHGLVDGARAAIDLVDEMRAKSQA
jgi:hypothetical protein